MPEVTQFFNDFQANKANRVFFVGLSLLMLLASLLCFQAGRQEIAEVVVSKEVANLQLQELLREKNQDLRHARRIIAGQRQVINSQGLSLWAASVILEVNQARLGDLEVRHGDDLRLIDEQAGVISTLDRACRAQ